MFLDLIALDMSSKAWVYQVKSKMTDQTVEGLRKDLWDFLEDWTSHNKRLYTYGNVFHEQFIAFFVDERYAGASGCSIDKSVHFLEDMEHKYGIDIFDRQHMTYMEKAEDDEGEDVSKIHTVALTDLKGAYARGEISDETWVFDNLVNTKETFIKHWVKPLGESWHRKFCL
jgi:hypothetical protein